MAGKAVVVGPHMENFQEIADAFRAEDALSRCATAPGLGRRRRRACSPTPRARDALGARGANGLVERNRGALARTVEALAGAGLA